MEEAVRGKAKRRHLNARDCIEMEQKPKGIDVLTQPYTVNFRQGNLDPNWRLYPTPTKQVKCEPASTSGSPSGQRKSLNSLSSVTRIICSSLSRSSQSSSSGQETRFTGELCPTDPNVKMDEEADDCDISLLASVMVEDPVAEEEDQVDDVSLLAAAMASEAKQKQEVDHLEGISPAMFGDDDEFYHCDIHDEEVDALPDVNYGLLGSSKNLVQPQGCIDDLPEEVLRQVLCQVPAQDLYRNISLVCHWWRNIVQDPKFVPFKKQYYRYMKREETTEKEISCILMSSHITNPCSSDHSIRNLVVVMAQHPSREHIHPEDILECVKKHRLFPQASSSIRLCIPDIQKNFSLGLKGPNPYAVMAVILILCENVDDVQALVSLLKGCMRETAITEYLSHMATMLLAIMRTGIEISNRLHYNIHYVLHLMENGPFSVSSGQSGAPQLLLTHEQQQILSHSIQTDHVVKIMAFAGTGKTTTLVKYAEQRPDLRFLYVSFNKSVASEAQRRFPKNVSCKTIHSLAYQDVGKSYRFRNKLTFNLKPFSINSVLPPGRGGYSRAKVVAVTLNTFMASADQTISLRHMPSYRFTKDGEWEAIDEHEKLELLHDARMIWNKMKALDQREKEGYYMTHDGYLKLWQLQTPKPRLSDMYDVIFVDEAQDCTPVIMDVLLSQHCGKILVGDPHQQIYTFRGAVNALNIVAHTHIYYLTQSFRFGEEIAYVGATILRVCKNVQQILVGGTQKGGVCDGSANDVKTDMTAGVSLCPGKTAILSRSNLTVFSEAVRLTSANPSCRVHFVGGIDGLGLSRIQDVWQLLYGSAGATWTNPNQQRRYIRDPLLRSFTLRNANPFSALKMYIKQTDDKELEAKVGIVEKYGRQIPELVKTLERCFEPDFNKADFILGTVHKAKGLEFDTVMVTDDFVSVPCSYHNRQHYTEFFLKTMDIIPHDEWNLLYVAVTRAKTTLIITKTIYRILTIAGEYFLKSAMPSTSGNGAPLIPCSVTDCPNHIKPSSAFVMSKEEKNCTDGVARRGLLCERCVWNRIGPIAFLMTDDVRSMAPIP